MDVGYICQNEKMTGRVKKSIRRAKRFAFELIGKEPKIRLEVRLPVERHGNEYGGWTILADSLNKFSKVYSFGVGTDVSFDVSIMAKYNCPIFAYDPTPAVSDFVLKNNLPGQFHFQPFALAGFNKIVRFYRPGNKKHISHSVIPNQQKAFIEVAAKDLGTLLEENGHSEIDVLKMDIEGSEYEVIENIVSKAYKIKQLLIEFHHFNPNIKPVHTLQAIHLLKKAGYRIFSISESGHEVSFLNMHIGNGQ